MNEGDASRDSPFVSGGNGPRPSSWGVGLSGWGRSDELGGTAVGLASGSYGGPISDPGAIFFKKSIEKENRSEQQSQGTRIWKSSSGFVLRTSNWKFLLLSMSRKRF